MSSLQVGGLRMRWGVLAAAALVVHGCGGTSSSRVESVGTSDAGNPVSDAGAPPAAADAGAPADAGTLPAPAPDAGLPPDAGATAQCDGLVPVPGTPVEVTLPVEGGLCAAARPGGPDGVVPLRHTDYDASGRALTQWSFFAAKTGRAVASWDADVDGPSDLWPQATGFVGVTFSENAAGDALLRVARVGLDQAMGPATEVPGNTAFAADPNGGFAAIHAGIEDGKLQVRYWRFDAAGVATKTAVPIATADAAGKPAPWATIGVTAKDGHALAIWGFTGASSACQAAWVDAAGRVTATFQPPACRVSTLYPLTDGSLAVDTYNLEFVHSIAASVQDQSTSWDPAPDWLSGDSLREFFLLPGLRGYALRQNGPGHDLDVVAPGGKLCGTVRTAELSHGPLRLGLDGTLVEQDFTGAGCTFRWYPGLFK